MKREKVWLFIVNNKLLEQKCIALWQAVEAASEENKMSAVCWDAVSKEKKCILRNEAVNWKLC